MIATNYTILLALATHHAGNVHPSPQDLATELGAESRRTIAMRLAELEASGYITCTQRGSGRRPTHYTVTPLYCVEARQMAEYRPSRHYRHPIHGTATRNPLLARIEALEHMIGASQ